MDDPGGVGLHSGLVLLADDTGAGYGMRRNVLTQRFYIEARFYWPVDLCAAGAQSCLVCFAKDISISSKRAMMIMPLSPAGRFYTTARSGIITTRIEVIMYLHSGFSHVPHNTTKV